MENQNINLKPIQTVHFGMCMVSVVFLLMVAVIRYFKDTERSPVFGDGPYYFIAPIVAVAALTIGTLSFKRNISAIETHAVLSEKIKKYEAAFLARQAFASAAATFNTVVYLLTAHYFFAVIATVMVLLLIAFRPTKFRVMQALQLNYTDLN